MPREIEAVEAARRLDIRKHRPDARALIEDSQRFLDIGRAKHGKPVPLEDVDDDLPG